jgi:hypothetical protein
MFNYNKMNIKKMQRKNIIDYFYKQAIENKILVRNYKYEYIYRIECTGLGKCEIKYTKNDDFVGKKSSVEGKPIWGEKYSFEKLYKRQQKEFNKLDKEIDYAKDGNGWYVHDNQFHDIMLEINDVFKFVYKKVYDYEKGSRIIKHTNKQYTHGTKGCCCQHNRKNKSRRYQYDAYIQTIECYMDYYDNKNKCDEIDE